MHKQLMAKVRKKVNANHKDLFKRIKKAFPKTDLFRTDYDGKFIELYRVREND